MRNFNFIYLLAFVALVSICCEQQNLSEKPEPTLEGSWELVKYIPHQHDETDWLTYGDSIVYQKHLSPDYFTWIKFDAKNNKLLGMGGGSYVLENGKYIENIEFFYPPGSSELGQAIPFDLTLKNNTWHHLGYAKTMTVNMESGKLEVTDSTKIEELWKKSDLKPNENLSLVGAWDLISYRDSLNGEYTEYPDFVGYMKLLTPTNFVWIYYDKDGDEIYATGSGRYTFDGTNYSETIDMMYPDNFGQLGSTVDFQAKINNNNWKHTGYLPNISIDNDNGNLVYDSSLIDEKWRLHEASVMDGITF